VGREGLSKAGESLPKPLSSSLLRQALLDAPMFSRIVSAHPGIGAASASKVAPQQQRPHAPTSGEL